MSTTNLECRMFHRGEHKRCFTHGAYTACDKKDYVLETMVTPENIHDRVAFNNVYDKPIQSLPEIETIVADAVYKTLHICKKVFQNGKNGRVLSTSYERPMTIKCGHPWRDYVYDEY